jgi:hypothetical protein
MHGMDRNADDYRDQWHDLAVQNNGLVLEQRSMRFTATLPEVNSFIVT